MKYDSRAKFEGIAVQRGEFEMFSFAFPGLRCCFAVVPAIRIRYQLTAHSGFGPTVARTLIRRILNLRGITHTFTILFVAEVVIRLITADCDSLIEGRQLSGSNREATSRTFFAGYY